MKRLSNHEFIEVDKNTSVLKLAIIWLSHERMYNVEHGTVSIPVNSRFVRFLEKHKMI